MSLAKILKIDPLYPEIDKISEAAKVIASGGLVIIPTDTVYGIAVNALNKTAQNKLYEIKKRPKDKPLALLIADKEKVQELAIEIAPAVYKLINKFWPGPLTILLKDKNGQKIGLRMPDNEIALKIISLSNLPLACPSANISDSPAPVTFEEAIKDLGGLVDLAVDAGPAKLGIESSIVDLSAGDLQIVRSGAIKDQDIIDTVKTKKVLFVCTGNSCRSVMAQEYLKKLLRDQGRIDVEVDSAGMMALEGGGVSEETRQVLAAEGIDASGHRAKKLTKALVDESDIILVMEQIHEDRVLHLAPEAKNRLFLLKEFAKINDSNLNIADPIGGSREFYQQIFSTIKDAAERISRLI